MIQSIDELQRVRLVQRAATSKAALEFNAAATKADLEEGRDNIVELLKSYAFQPSIREMEGSETARDLFQPGATFAVGFIVNAVILKFLEDQAFSSVHRKLLASVLLRMQGDMVNFLTTELNIGPDPRLNTLADAILFICERYGLFEKGVVTPLGRRCGVHMMDIISHIDIVADAHRRFRT